MKSLQFLGLSGAGKTTLLARLIPALKDRGLRTCVVKHSHHRHPTPAGGVPKDSDRLLDAGAGAVAWIGGEARIYLERASTEPALPDVLARLPECDLVLIEGWSRLDVDWVEVIGPGGERIADGRRRGRRLAVVSSDVREEGVPCFRPEEVERLADFVGSWCAEHREESRGRGSP